MNKLFKNQFTKIAIAPAIVLVLHIVATVAGWYENFWWFDIPLHFLGGVAIAISAYYFLEDFSNRKKFNTEFKPLQILILTAFVALAAVCWEFMEYTFDIVFITALQASLVDTIKDMAMGLIGGILTAIIITRQ